MNDIKNPDFKHQTQRVKRPGDDESMMCCFGSLAATGILLVVGGILLIVEHVIAAGIPLIIVGVLVLLCSCAVVAFYS